MRQTIRSQYAARKMRLVVTAVALVTSVLSLPWALAGEPLVEPLVEPGDIPPVPTGLSGPATDADGTYGVSWNHSFGASDYELQEKIGAGSWITTYSGFTPSKVFSSRPANAYSYRVRACYIGCSAFNSSLVVNVTGGIAPAATEGTVGAIGTTPYAITVATDGDATVSVPLQLIPGVADFAPSLSLEYASGRGIDRLERSLPEDTVGYGWRLAGLSQIRRCVVNQASSASIQLNNSDSLCLDGMPLVVASGTHFAVGAIYRTLIESYIKIEIKGTTGALWFETTLPDGTIHKYGNGTGSRVDKSGGTDYQWSISNSTSTDNNAVATAITTTPAMASITLPISTTPVRTWISSIGLAPMQRLY